MGKCLKGKSEVDADEATYICKKCGARTDDKNHVCKPKEVKESEGGKKGSRKTKAKALKEDAKETSEGDEAVQVCETCGARIAPKDLVLEPKDAEEEEEGKGKKRKKGKKKDKKKDKKKEKKRKKKEEKKSKKKDKPKE